MNHNENEAQHYWDTMKREFELRDSSIVKDIIERAAAAGLLQDLTLRSSLQAVARLERMATENFTEALNGNERAVNSIRAAEKDRAALVERLNAQIQAVLQEVQETEDSTTFNLRDPNDRAMIAQAVVAAAFEKGFQFAETTALLAEHGVQPDNVEQDVLIRLTEAVDSALASTTYANMRGRVHLTMDGAGRLFLQEVGGDMVARDGRKPVPKRPSAPPLKLEDINLDEL